MKNSDPVAYNTELIPDGEYLCVFISGTISKIYGGPRAVLEFEILTGCKFEGVRLPFYAPLKRAKGKPLIPPGSKYYVAWSIANGRRRPSRGDRMSFQVFKGKVFKVRVGTANQDKDELQRYSVIREILEVEAGLP